MAKYPEEAKAIIAAVGGEGNISAATNCVTRLRFALVDEGKVDTDALDDVDLVKGYFNTAGQYQVIIGPGVVEDVAADIKELMGGKTASKDEVKAAAAEKLNPLQQFVKIFSDIFVPLLPALVTAGLLMGINNILTQPGIFGGVDAPSLVETYPGLAGIAGIIITIANTPFVFLPVLIGWSAAKRFGGSPLLGIVLGAMLVHPDLLNAWGYGSAPEIPTWDIFGWEIAKMGYQGQVLPILVAAWVMVKIEKWLRDRVPESAQLLVVAPVTLLVTGFLSFAIIGPVTFLVGTWLATGVTAIFNVAPTIGGLVYGFFYAPLVITGMHHTFLAVDLQLLATYGVTFLWPILALSNIAQGSASIGIGLASKTEKQKSLAYTSGVSAYLGITEPALFGVNLRYRFPFVVAISCAAIGGAFIATFGVVASSIGVGGLPGIFAIPPQYWMWFGIAMLFEVLVPLIVVWTIAKRQFGKVSPAVEAAEENAELAPAQAEV